MPSRAEVAPPRFGMEGSMLLLEEPVRDLEPHHGLEHPCRSALCTVLPTSLPIVGWSRMYRGRAGGDEARLVTINCLCGGVGNRDRATEISHTSRSHRLTIPAAKPQHRIQPHFGSVETSTSIASQLFVLYLLSTPPAKLQFSKDPSPPHPRTLPVRIR